MDKSELMKQLDISQATYYRLLKEGMPSKGDKKKLFDLDQVIEWRNNRNNARIEELVIGEEYSNQAIAEIFKCSTQGGMRRSHTSNSLVLFTDHTGKSVYEDEWIDNVLHYTGMGLEGNQEIKSTQNKILANSNKNRIRVYLFETFEATKHTYSGKVKLVDYPYTILEKDSTGSERLVYKFPLKIISEAAIIDEEKIKKSDEGKSNHAIGLSFSELEKRAQVISHKNVVIKKKFIDEGKSFESYRFIKKREYLRDPSVAEYVKTLANGICQLCEEPAPFEKKGVPFLHSHHIHYLSEGGLDTIDNCVAVCPNCHARIHELELNSDKERLLEKIFKR